MLISLSIQNIALMDEMQVEFSTGLHVLTGETGAGKSILIGSVLLALGGRYTSDMIRSGEKAGFVELVFSVDNDSVKEELLKTDDELDLSDGLLTGQSAVRPKPRGSQHSSVPICSTALYQGLGSVPVKVFAPHRTFATPWPSEPGR